MNLANLLCILLHTASPAVETVSDAPAPSRVELYGGGGYLASLGGSGAAANVGVRVKLAKHLAGTFDFGWGLLHDGKVAEDRWWLMPSLELTAPLGPIRADLGAGFGLATSSGYPDVATFGQRPFGPDWAFQLAPAARGYVRASWDRWFVRADVGTLLLDGNQVGLRSGNPSPTAEQTHWALLWLGAAIDL